MRWSNKDPAEILPVGFELSAALSTGEALIAVACTVSVASGTDATPEAILLGDPAIVGTSVQQWIQAGVDGADYQLRFTVDTDGGKRLVEASRVLVTTREQ